MFFQVKASFLIFAMIVSSSYLPVLASDSDEEGPELLPLTRRTSDGTLCTQYTDNLSVQEYDYKYKLNYPVDRRFVREAGCYGKEDGKSHVLVNGFCVYKQDGKVSIHYNQLTTRLFSHIGIGKKKTDTVIDWTSYGSTLPDTTAIIRRKSHKGEGHSECQFIADIREVCDMLLKTKPSVVLDCFLPPVDARKDALVMMSGLDFYGYFDMCDDCLGDLRDLRMDHQSGKKSISNALCVALGEDGCTDVDEDRFVPIYHAYAPYASKNKDKDATYYTTYDETDYQLSFHGESEPVIVKGKVQYKRCVSFKVCGEKAAQKDKNLLKPAGTALSQSATVPQLKKDMIYIHIDGLAGKRGKYQKPAMNEWYQFIFNGQ